MPIDDNATQKQSDTPGDGNKGWLGSLVGLVPRIQTPFQLAAYALVVLILIIQFTRGASVFSYSLSIVAIILVILTTAIADQIKKRRKQGLGIIVIYFGMIAAVVLVLVLAYSIDRRPGQIAWDGGRLVDFTQILEDNERVKIEIDESLSDIKICHDATKFTGDTVKDVLDDVAWSNSKCMTVLVEADGIVKILRGSQGFVWSEQKACHECVQA